MTELCARCGDDLSRGVCYQCSSGGSVDGLRLREARDGLREARSLIADSDYCTAAFAKRAKQVLDDIDQALGSSPGGVK